MSMQTCDTWNGRNRKSESGGGFHFTGEIPNPRQMQLMYQQQQQQQQHQRWNPRNSMAFNSAKGLLNPVGENNCFLNCAVQVLWHLDVFRRNFRLLNNHACLGHSCIFCALKNIFAQYQFSRQPALPADSLRHALAQTFADRQRFQMGSMDDASECFENILLCIHQNVVPDDEAGAECKAPHCIPHQKFTMKVKEQVVCQCRASSNSYTFDQMVHYVSTTSLIAQIQHSRSRKIFGHAMNFGQLLKEAKNDGEARQCTDGCERLASVHQMLTNSPEVMCLGFIWDSERPSFEHVRGVVNAIGTELRPADLFDSVADLHLGEYLTHKLVGVVCYYGRHYSTFLFHSKMRTWILFDDARIQEIGPDWRQVADRCCQGHYQPLLLLYSSENPCPINTVATAPRPDAALLGQSDCSSRSVLKNPCGNWCQIISQTNSIVPHKMSPNESNRMGCLIKNQDCQMDEKFRSSSCVGMGRQPSYFSAVVEENAFHHDGYLSPLAQALGSENKRCMIEMSEDSVPGIHVTTCLTGNDSCRTMAGRHCLTVKGRPTLSSSRTAAVVQPTIKQDSNQIVRGELYEAGKKKLDDLTEIAEDDGFGQDEYINAKMVESILMSQGLKVRGRCRKNISAASKQGQQQQHSTRTVCHPSVHFSSHSRTAVPRNVVISFREAQGSGGAADDSLDVASLGSHKDSGYRSGDSSVGSASSSSSIESGEFVPAQNAAQLIAAENLENRENPSDGWPEPYSLESTSSLSSSNYGMPRKQRNTEMGFIQATQTHFYPGNRRIRNSGTDNGT